MTYLLDTNLCVSILRGDASILNERLQEVPRSDVTLCSVVSAELLYGAYKSSDPPTSLKTVRDFIASFSSFPFNEEAAEVYGRIRYDLSKKGILIGPNDLMIASIAYSNGAILVTHNVREFGRVEGLKMEDWEENP